VHLWQRAQKAESLICVVLLAVLPVVAFFPAFFLDKVPLDLESVFFSSPWEEARPAGLEPPQSPHAALHAQRYYPWYRFLGDAAQEGDSLLWNPLEGFGAPFLAVWRTRVLSPFSIPFYVLPLLAALGLSVYLKLLVAGWSAYYAARRFGFAQSTALLVSVAFQMSGPVYLWSGYPLSDVLPWFPLLLVSVERLMAGRSRAWPLTAIVVALMALGGDPETLCACVLFLGLYLMARRLRDPRWAHLPRATVGCGLAVVFGLGLAAPQLAPYIEFLGQAAPAADTPRSFLHMTDLVAAFSPHLLSPDRIPAAPVINLLHFGVTQLLLLALWCALRDFVSGELRRRVEALFLTAFVMLLVPVAAGTSLDRIPGLRLLGAQHFLVTHAFAFAFMTAAAAEEWNELNPQQCKATLSRLLLYVPALWGLLFGGIALGLARHGAPSAGIKADLFLSAGIALAIFLLLAATLIRPNVRLVSYGLALLTFVSLFWNFGPAIPYAPASQVFPETEFIASLGSMDTRIGGSQALRQWPLAGNGIPQVFNPADVTLKRYRAFIERTQEDPLLLRRTGAQALLLTKQDIQGDFASVRPVLNIQEVYPAGAILFKDLEAQPRARMIYAGRPVDHFEPAELSSQLPPLIEGCSLPGHDEGPVAAASIGNPDSHGSVTVRVEATRPGILVLADAWYPGWRATVNGQPKAIIPVDGVFRGVEVGEGKQEVVFTYAPESLRIGLIVSAVCAGCMLLSLRHTVLTLVRRIVKRQPTAMPLR